MHRIVVLDDYQGEASNLADWSKLGEEAEVVFIREHVEGEELFAVLQDAEVILAMRERTALRSELLKRIPTLKLIVTAGMSNVAIDIAWAIDNGIVVTGALAGGNEVTEHTWALILDAVKHVAREDRAMRRGAWQETIAGDLQGATLGILGLGKLGATMVPIANVFKMKVIAWSQNLDPAHAESLGAEYVSKDDFFARSDVITIHYKLSDRTRGLVGRDELAQMKPTAILVNTSRGPIVDEAALIDALEHNVIAGAALDVYDTEPMLKDHRFYALENVTLTPHLGYASRKKLSGWYQAMADNVAAYLAGSPINVIKKG